MNIWTISLFDPTPYDKVGELRFIQIAKAALRAGHTVTHFTSTFRHTSKKHRFSENKTIQIEPDYTIEYVHSKGYEKNISVKRIFAHADFAKKLVNSFQNREHPDLIFISMPPLSAADEVIIWASSKNIPVVTDIIDPWPDSFIKDVPKLLKPASRVIIYPLYRKIRRILRESTAVTSISNGYLDWAHSQYPGIQQTRCFYPALNLSEITEKMDKLNSSIKRDEEILRIIYVGSLGSSYDIPAIVKAAEIMDKKYPGETEFVIAGKGPQSGLAEEYAEKLNNLSYLGWISDEELMKQYYMADLGLIQHKNNLTQTVTYKLFSYLSAGLPILNSLLSEMADIIEENEVGLNNGNGEYHKLADNIEQFLNDKDLLQRYKKNAIELTKRKGDSIAVYGEMIKLFEEIVESGDDNVFLKQKADIVSGK